jgi:hypothetical protein
VTPAPTLTMPIANIGSILLPGKQIGGDAIETAVAKAYLIQHVNDFDRVEFHVGIGPGIKLAPDAPDYMQTWADKSTRLRADMVCWRGDVPTIVEVKDRILPPVVGQLLAYWHHLREDNPKLLNVYKVVAARTIAPAMLGVLERYGITYELFPNVQVLGEVAS